MPTDEEIVELADKVNSNLNSEKFDLNFFFQPSSIYLPPSLLPPSAAQGDLEKNNEEAKKASARGADGDLNYAAAAGANNKQGKIGNEL